MPTNPGRSTSVSSRSMVPSQALRHVAGRAISSSAASTPVSSKRISPAVPGKRVAVKKDPEKGVDEPNELSDAGPHDESKLFPLARGT